MHVHHCHPGAIVAEVNVVGDDPGLVRLDELDQLLHGGLQLFERPLVDIRSVDIHDHIRRSMTRRPWPKPPTERKASPLVSVRLPCVMLWADCRGQRSNCSLRRMSRLHRPACSKWAAGKASFVIGMVVVATPAGAHVGGTVSHLWNQHIRPKADARYVKLSSPQAPLRSGVTIRGVIGGDFHASAASSDWRVLQSFPIPSPIVLPDGRVDVDGQDEVSNRCTGTVGTPTAPPGVVCIYLENSGNASNFVGYGAPECRHRQPPRLHAPLERTCRRRHVRQCIVGVQSSARKEPKSKAGLRPPPVLPVSRRTSRGARLPEGWEG